MAKYKKKEVVRIPFELGFPPSESQLEILEKVNRGGNNMISAVAGSGKSSTLAYIMSQLNNPKGIYVAFNKDIVDEMEPKCPPSVDVKTRHSVGYGVTSKGTGKRLKLDSFKVLNILGEHGWPDQRTDPKSWERRKSMSQLVDQMRNNMVEPDDILGISEIVNRYGITIDVMQEFISKLPDIFADIVRLGHEGVIDFIDMKWLPVYCNFEFPKYNILYLDEYQDSSNLDMEFDKRLLKGGGQVIAVGDKNQSIYGFAGANCNSMDIAEKFFSPSITPLNVTYRCARNIVEACKSIVPHFMAWGKAPDGIVEFLGEYVEELDFSRVQDNAMLLCRRNAPLVRPCFAALKEGRKANIKGKDIGKSIVKTVRSFRKSTLHEMLDALEEHTETKKQKILARSKPSMPAIESLDDTRELINAFADQPQIKEISDLCKYVESLFVESGKGMMFSSVHKSKGLESDQVVILENSKIRLSYKDMTEEAVQQEANLNYVAYSRARKELLTIG